MRPIFLVGYMGCGKSTLGRAVSRMTGFPFIDLDTYIEGRFHLTVKEIFASKGEAGFRELERKMLREVADFEDVIVACGGGTPCFHDNMDYMNSRGVTVFLDAPIPTLFGRLKCGRHKRPLIASKTDDELLAYINEALAARLPYYRKAAVVFSSELLENRDEIAATTKSFIDKFNIPYRQQDAI